MNDLPEQAAAAQAPVSPAMDLSELDGEAGCEPLAAQPPRFKRWKWVGLLLLGLGIGASCYWLCGSQAQQAGAYKTAPVSRGDIIQSVTASGSISPIKTVTVGSQVSGQIIALMADYNARVTNGQVVAQLDPSTYQQSLVQAEAELANAKSALSLAQLSFRRAKQLDEQKAKPHSEFEKAEVELEQAQAVARSRQAALKKAQVDLERTTIYSPIDGFVISRAVDVGQTVAANFNAPTLFTIAEDLRQMRIEAAVSEADIGGVAEGQPVHFSVDAFPTAIFQGQVTQVRFEPSSNQNVVTYACIVNVRNDELKLRPGMTANATIITCERKNILRIPNAAFRFAPTTAAAPGHSNGPERTVWMLENPQAGAGAADTLKAVSIQTGVSDGTWTELLSGLGENELVVTGVGSNASQSAAASSSSSKRNPFSMGGPGGPPPH